MIGIDAAKLFVRLFREGRRVQDARLRIAREKTTLALMYRRMLSDTLATPTGLLTCAGLGLAVGLLRDPPAETQSRARTIRSLIPLALWISRARHWLAPDAHG
jgi:hypothetical protein